MDDPLLIAAVKGQIHCLGASSEPPESPVEFGTRRSWGNFRRGLGDAGVRSPANRPAGRRIPAKTEKNPVRIRAGDFPMPQARQLIMSKGSGCQDKGNEDGENWGKPIFHA